MKKVKMSFGDAELAAHMIHVVFNLDSNKKPDQNQKDLQQAGIKYLQSLGVLNGDGNLVYAEFPTVVFEAAEAYM